MTTPILGVNCLATTTRVETTTKIVDTTSSLIGRRTENKISLLTQQPAYYIKILHQSLNFHLLKFCFTLALSLFATSHWSEVCASLPISLPPVIRLGAIFTEDQRASKIESAFKYAIYRINKDKTMLPDTQIVYDIEYISRDDTFRSTKKVCRQLETGVQAIFGPTDALLATHIQSICDSFGIPHIETRIDIDVNSKEFSINLYPSQHSLNMAYRDLMFYLNWTKVAIVYEEDYGKLINTELLLLY